MHCRHVHLDNFSGSQTFLPLFFLLIGKVAFLQQRSIFYFERKWSLCIWSEAWRTGITLNTDTLLTRKPNPVILLQITRLCFGSQRYHNVSKTNASGYLPGLRIFQNNSAPPTTNLAHFPLKLLRIPVYYCIYCMFRPNIVCLLSVCLFICPPVLFLLSIINN